MPRVPGDDPRFGGADFDLYLVDNGAGIDIENLVDDSMDPVDVDDDPNLPGITDGDGVPGYRPFVDASTAFEQPPTPDPDYDGDNSDSDDLEVAQNSADVLGDEFTHRLQQREDAKTDVNGRPVDDLTQMAQVQAAQSAAVAEAAPFTSINPPSSVDALLGGSAKVTTAGPPVELARWTAESQVESCPVTVGLGRVAPNPNTIDGDAAGSLLPFRPFAIVQYGTRNASISFEVDIGPGTQFTIGATAVNVMVQMDAYKPGTSFAANEYGSLVLAGQLSFYPIVRTAPVTRTIYYDAGQIETNYVQIEAANVITIVVPLFAKRVSFFRDNSIAAGADTYNFQDSQGNTVTLGTVAANAYFTEPVLLPGDVYFIQIQGAGASLASYRFVFELSL